MWIKAIGLIFLGVWVQLSVAATTTVVSVSKGFSTPLRLIEPAETIAIGDPGVIGVNTLKPDLLMVNGQDLGATSLTVFGKSGRVFEYRVQVVNDIYQLRSMVLALEKKVTVEDLNGIIVLKGTVPTPAALARVLTVADRFVTGSSEPPDFSVISDHGGVLSGNLDEAQTGVDEEISGVSPDPRIAIPQINVGGRAQGGGGAGRNGANGSVTQALRQPLMPIKGNLAQNLSRGEVIVVGKGKVMSMIKVAKQPKVEIQMQIIGIDRNKTDSYGLDWRLDALSGGKAVTVGSVLGDVSSSGANSPDQLTNNGFDPGSSSLFAFVNNPGKYALSAFMRFLQQKGAAKTLSNPLVTAVSGESASFLVGGNIPIPVQTQTVNQVTATTATNVRFIQFGLKLIVRPTVLENGKISIVLDQSISEPDYSQSITLLGARIPGFNQRSVSTLTESASGETWAVAGLLSEENTRNASQIPWLSNIPVLGWLFKTTSDAKSRNELMILVNARVVEADNETKVTFENDGELAPNQSEVPDIPASEDVFEKPLINPDNNQRTKPRSGAAAKPAKGARKLDLPSVVVPDAVRGVRPAPVGETSTQEGNDPDAAMSLPQIIIPEKNTNSIIALSQTVKADANQTVAVRKIEGRLISYQEFDSLPVQQASNSQAKVAMPVAHQQHKALPNSELVGNHGFLSQVSLFQPRRVIRDQ